MNKIRGLTMEEKLYGDIGKSLRSTAVFCGVIGLIAVALGVLGLITLLFDDDTLPQTIILLVSGLALYGSSLWMYGFAQVVDDIHVMRLQGKNVVGETTSTKNLDARFDAPKADYLKNMAMKTPNNTTKRCPYCGDIVKAGRCEMCGKEVK